MEVFLYVFYHVTLIVEKLFTLDCARNTSFRRNWTIWPRCGPASPMIHWPNCQVMQILGSTSTLLRIYLYIQLESNYISELCHALYGSIWHVYHIFCTNSKTNIVRLRSFMLSPPETLPEDLKTCAKRIQVLPGPHLRDFTFMDQCHDITVCHILWKINPRVVKCSMQSRRFI